MLLIAALAMIMQLPQSETEFTLSLKPGQRRAINCAPGRCGLVGNVNIVPRCGTGVLTPHRSTDAAGSGARGHCFSQSIFSRRAVGHLAAAFYMRALRTRFACLHPPIILSTATRLAKPSAVTAMKVTAR
jgi:hypothetical protein